MFPLFFDPLQAFWLSFRFLLAVDGLLVVLVSVLFMWLFVLAFCCCFCGFGHWLGSSCLLAVGRFWLCLLVFCLCLFFVLLFFGLSCDFVYFGWVSGFFWLLVVLLFVFDSIFLVL